MRILITNDDGVTAPGLIVMAQRLLDDGHEVSVIGPLTERSGSGSAIGSIEHGAVVPLQRIPLPTTPPLVALALDAPPALAMIAAATGQFGPRPDVVVSGINPGHNLGQSILFSGTVGATLAARMVGLPGIAVSCGFEPEGRYDTAAEFAAAAVESLGLLGFPLVTLNLNVPDVDPADVPGVRVTRLGARSMFALRIQEEVDRLVLTREFLPSSDDEGSDLHAVLDGVVSITELKPMDSIEQADVADRIAEALTAHAGAIVTGRTS